MRAVKVASIAVMGLVLCCAVYLGISALPSSETVAQSPSPKPPSVTVDPTALRAIAGRGRLIVRAVDPKLPRLDGRLYATEGSEMEPFGRLSCKRVHASGGGLGTCFTFAENAIDYDGIVFGPDGRPRRRFPIPGVPDRARVSRDGRFGTFTSFDRRSSIGYFETSEDFKTYARIFDMRTGLELVKLEELKLTRAGRPIDRLAAARAQFWGVTFVGDDRYYATANVDRAHYLISGRIGSDRARVVRDHVECPALSPDGGRIAYKRRIPGTNTWRLHVLNLETGADVELAETRSIDDQPEWGGDDWILYSDDRDVFAVPADGRGKPEKIVENATSPAVVD